MRLAVKVEEKQYEIALHSVSFIRGGIHFEDIIWHSVKLGELDLQGDQTQILDLSRALGGPSCAWENFLLVVLTSHKKAGTRALMVNELVHIYASEVSVTELLSEKRLHQLFDT